MGVAQTLSYCTSPCMCGGECVCGEEEAARQGVTSAAVTGHSEFRPVGRKTWERGCCGATSRTIRTED